MIGTQIKADFADRRLSASGSNWTFQAEFGDQPIWENVENFWRQSPIKYIGNAKTPTLVIHSEQDMRCNMEQDEQVFVALIVGRLCSSLGR